MSYLLLPQVTDISQWSEPVIGLPPGAWKKWGRRHGRLLSADAKTGNLMIFLINTNDLILYHVLDFNPREFGRLATLQSAACAMVGSQVYIIGGLGARNRRQRRTDIYVCDLSKPQSQYKWSRGPDLLIGMVYPLLVCLGLKIYALDVPEGTGSGGSFRMLDSSGVKWKMLSTPPFFPFPNAHSAVRSIACVGDDKIVVHFVQETVEDDCVIVAVFYLYDVNQNEWSILRKVKGVRDTFLEDDIQLAASAPVPYRAYVQDVFLFPLIRGSLFVLDFQSLGEGDPEENPRLYDIDGPNEVDSWFVDRRWSYSEWHMHHLGRNKFCIVFTCVPQPNTPCVDICSFDLVQVKRDHEKVTSFGEDVDRMDVDEAGSDIKRRKTEERIAFKVMNFRDNGFIGYEMGFLPESCRRPSITVPASCSSALEPLTSWRLSSSSLSSNH